MNRLIWLHEDMLRLDNHPVFTAEDDTAFFIWDAVYLKKMDYGFKKLVFIYETPIVETAVELARNHDCSSLYTIWSPNPELQTYISDISNTIDLEIIRDVPFAKLEKTPDLKRFFRYWNKAKKYAFEQDGGFER